jgi:hypothetical protein
MVPGHLGSAHIIAARAAGADPQVLAAVIRGAVAEQMTAEELNRIRVPVLVLNGKADVANQKCTGVLKEISTATFRDLRAIIIRHPISRRFIKPSRSFWTDSGGSDKLVLRHDSQKCCLRQRRPS